MTKLTPDEMDAIRTKAQEQTAHLYFMCALYAAIPLIFMANMLGVNCSCLGRKTLILINLSTSSVRYLLYILQCIFEDWPDWLFYVGSFIENFSGSNGIFYLALYCFIADLTPPSERSWRIAFVHNLNSIATLCVTYACGYVIKYYSYFYLFLASWCLVVFALFYTLLFIPEPLVELKGKSMWSRLRDCSIKKSSNCLTVYFNTKPDLSAANSNNETQHLLADETNNNEFKKQTFVLLLVVFTNFIFVFGTQGISSIFTLYIMNAPYCFDSIQISEYSIFTTLVSLVNFSYQVRNILVNKFPKSNLIN